MKIALLVSLFFSYTIHSQIAEEWENFELNSEWSINYIENDTIIETSNTIGKLIFTSKIYPITVKFDVLNFKPQVKYESKNILKSIYFKENPNVMDEFYFKNKYYKLILSSNLMFKYKIYNTLVSEIENYIK